MAVYRARAAYVAERWGRVEALGSEDKLKAQALSVVWANVKFLGCRYPAAVEKEAGCGTKLRAGVDIADPRLEVEDAG